MEIHFNNILVSVKFLDFTFQNPVELRLNEDGPVIGSAVLSKKKSKLYADLIINERIDYNLYPRVGIDVLQNQIGYIFLSAGQSIDPEVKTIKEQNAQLKS